jgi:hypothetical protein
MVAWGDVPTWVTAGAALLAVVAATVAFNLQRQQLKDQQAATLLQAQAIADQNRLREREQANRVDVRANSIDGAAA